ncbi:hypothetical protein [Sulfobacillus harzensis]|uniref:Uncharacterized protein n=1 Tax=Sulfobacillus harzensis TaxID=2729629 RepID=A0A7Y0Q4J6_9FIRM|nr:hypothetical protein [Sulfobacillus harzensis]NMP24485.1 hypothetical protein [Sulfobacillus harzensis]
MSGLIAGAALASLVISYQYWRRVKEPAYRLMGAPVIWFLLVGTWAVWTIAVHHARNWPVLVVAVIACHIAIFIFYGAGSSLE